MRFYIFLFAAIVLSITEAEAQRIELQDTQLSKEQFDSRRWPYPLHAEELERMETLALRYPKLVRLHNIGESTGGYDLWLIEVTNQETGPGESKPAMWMDSNLHPDELPGRRYLRYFYERLLASYRKDPEVTRLVDTRTYYILPILNPDAGEWFLTRQPSWPGHEPERHIGKDLDGDGYITRMRVKDVSANNGYRTYIEGQDINVEVRGAYSRYRKASGDREPTDFNRNWSAGWRPEEPGGGPYPFSLPEVYAVAKFIAEHKNIFFHYTIHTGGGIKNYQVRPPFNYPYQTMHHEDNDFYVRVGAIWSMLNEGGLMENNFYSYVFTAGRTDEEGKQMGYTATMAGFAGDWAYSHMGIHSLTPECSGVGIDYNGDGFITGQEVMRWNEEEEGGRFFAEWKLYNHPELGEIEIGGDRDMPQAYGRKLDRDADIQYKLLLNIANLAPEISIVDMQSKQLSRREYKVTATVKNDGWLATYVTRQAIANRKDFPVIVDLDITGGEIVDGVSRTNIGHLLGKWSDIRNWDEGKDVPSQTVEWTVRLIESGPLKITVNAWAHKGGSDSKSITIE